MSVKKSQIAATSRYEKKVYDKILLRMPKGKKAIIKAHAEQKNESVNGFISRAIDETIERDTNNE